MSERRSRRRRQSSADKQALNAVVKMTQPLNNTPPYELLGPAGTEKIVKAIETILKDHGMEYLDDPEALEIWRKNGAKVDGTMVYIDEDMLREFVGKAPSHFTQLAPNPANNVTIGNGHMCFAPVYGPPFVTDMDNGRREGTYEDFVKLIKLSASSPWLHHSGGTICEPNDLPVHNRHLDMLLAHTQYNDRAFMGSVTAGNNAEDSIKFAEVLYGADAIRENPALISLINVSSPRRYDDRMLACLKAYARAKQAMVISPFGFSGAMASVSSAATIAQLAAESLSGIVFSQMINAGTPVVMGVFQTNIDLQSGAPVFGSPEGQFSLFGIGEIARHYNLPYRSGGAFASSKIADAQAGYESIMSIYPAVQAHVNFMLHAAGWLEGGLATGYEKLVLDAEMLGALHKFMQGFEVSDATLDLDATIAAVPPGGHHLGTEYTMKHFRDAFHRNTMFDYDPFETWAENGAPTTMELANKRWKQQLKDYQAPTALDDAKKEELAAFVAKRKEEIPAVAFI